MQTETLNVTGMSCGACISRVTQALTAVPGVGQLNVSLPGQARVEFGENLTTREQLQSAIKGAGYGVVAGGDATESQSKGACCG